MLKIDFYIFIFFFFSVTMILLLFLFGINSLIISYIFSFINKSRNTIITVLSLVPVGFGKLHYIIYHKNMKKMK